MSLTVKEPRLEIWPESPDIHGETVEIKAVAELDGRKFKDIWFRLPYRWQSWVTDSADPFVLSAVFAAMARGSNLTVHGQVSPSLL